MYLCSYLEFVTYVMNNIEIQSVLDLKHFFDMISHFSEYFITNFDRSTNIYAVLVCKYRTTQSGLDHAIAF